MTERTMPAVLSEFISGISKASVAAWAMTHYHACPDFLPVRDTLELIKDRAVGIATNAKVTVRTGYKQKPKMNGTWNG